MAKPAYGLILVGGKAITSTADERYAGGAVTSSSYNVVADAAFSGGYCHNVGADNTDTTVLIPFQGAGLSESWDLAVGESVRVGERIDPAAVRGSYPAGLLYQFGFTGAGGSNCVIQVTTLNWRIWIQDKNGKDTYSADISNTGLADTYIELEIQHPTATTLKGVVRSDGVEKGSVTATIDGADQTFAIQYWAIGNQSSGDKGATANPRYDFEIIGTFNDGSINTDAEQWPYDWAPTISAWNFPTADVVNTFAVGGWADLDDAIGSYASNNVLTADNTTGYDLIMSFTDEASVSAPVHAVVSICFSQWPAGTWTNLATFAFTARKSDGTIIQTDACTQPDDVNAPAVLMGIFPVDADGAVWTQTSINAYDFGIRKVAGTSSAVSAYALGRVVVYGGNAVKKAVIYQRRASMRANLIR